MSLAQYNHNQLQIFLNKITLQQCITKYVTWKFKYDSAYFLKAEGIRNPVSTVRTNPVI